jgi:FAD:protein FMN transferase
LLGRRLTGRSEHTKTFTCLGGYCTVAVGGSGPAGGSAKAVTAATDALLAWHESFSRFKPESELSSLNRDPRERVPVSAMMARFVQAATEAASATGGLVDPTLLDEIEEAGYRADRLRGTAALALTLALASPRRPAGPHPDARWRQISIDVPGGSVSRPPGVKLDGGGIVKGLFADALGEMLSEHRSFAVDCEGDRRFGGTGDIERTIQVASPFDRQILHEYAISDGAISTTGISKRSWLEGGKPAHHLLDPATGRPAYTGVVEVTALAPTALEGEALAKAAILSGPDAAPDWLRHGGVIVFDDGSHAVVAAPTAPKPLASG